MTPLAPTKEHLNLAQRVIWFEDPDVTHSDPLRFMAYAFRYAGHHDLYLIQASYDKETLAQALPNAPLGIFDARSWAYWNLILRDLSPPPPMPTRTFA